MKYKKSIILLMLAVCILAAATVSAGEAKDTAIVGEAASAIELSQAGDDERISVEENELMGQTENDELINDGKGGTFAELQANIAAATAGSTVTLTKDYECEDGFDSQGILIDKSITIDGQGHKIDAQGKSRIFNVSTADAVLKNIIFINANSGGSGGAVNFEKSGTVINCVFTNNTSIRNGAAICFYGEGSVSNSNFTGNQITGDTQLDGNVVFFNRTGNISNSNFINNHGEGSKIRCGAAYFARNGVVTNCNFTNNSNAHAGAVFFNRNGTLSNSNFINNSGVYAGAVYFVSDTSVRPDLILTGKIENCNLFNNNGLYGAVCCGNCTIENCNFVNNAATKWGGAVCVNPQSDCNIINCNFINNTAVQSGGAVYFLYSSTGKLINCDFADNTANEGCDIYAKDNCIADTCIFKRSSGNVYHTEILSPTLNVNNYIIFYNSGEKVKFDLKTNGGIYLPNGNISISIYNKTNNRWIGNYSGLSGDGWIVNLPIGEYYAVYNTKYFGLAPVNKTITVNPPKHTFWALNYIINRNFFLKIDLSNDFYFDQDYDADFAGGIAINQPFTINGNGFSIDAKGQARIFIVKEEGTVIKNMTLKNANYGGNGGAILFSRSGRLEYCNFTNNTANWGGAVYFMNGGNVANCNFAGNNATSGSAICFAASGAKIISDSSFLNNRANMDFKTPLNINVNENNITIIFMGQNNLLNAIYSTGNVMLTNVTYWGAKGIVNTAEYPPSRSNLEAGQNITVGVVVNRELVLNEVKVTDENGTIVLNITAGDSYFIGVRHEEDSYYTGAEEIISKNVKFYANVTSVTTDSRTVNITAKSNIPNDVVKGNLLFMLPDGLNIAANYSGMGIWWAVHTFDDCGEYNVSAYYVGLDNVTISNATVTVNKVKTVLTANSIIAGYNANSNLVVTLKDIHGNPLVGQTLTLGLNGVKTYITDRNGQIKVPIKGLVPKAYTAKITFKESAYCLGSSLEVKVTVKKAKLKLAAKKKTFKKSKKVKKYSVTLKDATKKPIKNAKLTIKIKKKTFKAKTNKKGKATFKIKKLAKKGTYKAKVTFKGNKYYSKVTKTVKIRIR